MKVISKKDFLARRGFFIDEMIRGKIFIYPTDTIYGIGCDARNVNSILKIRDIKKRENKPFSVIAPSKDWIIKNCIVDLHKLKFLKRLPGPYTLIFKLKKQDAIAKKEIMGEFESVGVRMPNNWFLSIVNKSQFPFVTTSVNISGEKHITKIKDLKKEISSKVDYIIDCGKLEGSPSKIIDLSSKDTKFIER